MTFDETGVSLIEELQLNQAEGRGVADQKDSDLLTSAEELKKEITEGSEARMKLEEKMKVF